MPITIETILLTVICLLGLAVVSPLALVLQLWAVRMIQQINFESLILRGMLSLLLFAGAFFSIWNSMDLFIRRFYSAANRVCSAGLTDCPLPLVDSACLYAASQER